MFTETELRDMLRHSADRAHTDPQLPTAPPPSAPLTIVDIADRRERTGRRVLIPIAGAAASVAVIAATVGLVHLHQPSTSGTTPAAAASLTPSPVQSSSPTASAPAVLGVPVVDEVHLDTGNETDNFVGADSDGSGQQVIRSQIGNNREANLVIAPAAAFDDHNIALTHPVTIAGTTGYYAVLRLFPLSAGGDGGSDPTGTIVFRTPDQHWAFAWLQQGTDDGNQAGTPVDDPHAIVDGFDTLHATFTPGTARSPFHVRYLPADAVFANANLTTVGSALSVAGILAQSGNKQMDIALLNNKYALGSAGGAIDRTTCLPTPEGCTVQLHRDLPGGFTLTVNGTNYTAAETQKVLDNLTVVTNPDDASTYYLLTAAVG